MTFLNLTNKQIVISRLTPVSGNKKIYATLTAGLAEIQLLSPEKTNLYNGMMGKTYQLYTDPSTDISEGDILREVDTGNRYKVKTGGITRRTQGSIDYLSVIVEQIN